MTRLWLTSTNPPWTAMTCSAWSGSSARTFAIAEGAEERHVAGQERDLAVGGAAHHHLGVAFVQHPLG